MSDLMKPLVILLLMSAPLFSQDHAPTLAQCQADKNLWYGESGNHLTDINNYLDGLSYMEISDRGYEMQQCALVDPHEEYLYRTLRDTFYRAALDRLKNFVARHGLAGQFLKEDQDPKNR